MEDLEIISEELLTELFNMGSAKGYPYTVSAPGEYPADPAITFQAVFTDDHGTEFAFRVYKANLIQGSGQRKYGKNTRVLAFMRRKTKNFAQNITVDSGTFKKVLVTFMQCYTEYKDSKDGPLASSYAIILQASLKPYATLFVRATARAFKSNRKLHLSLYGVNEESTNGAIELLYVNPQTIYPYWGGPEFDEAKFVGNPTHVKLSKLEGHEVQPAVAGQVTPVSVAGDPAATTAQTPAATAPADNLPDPMNNPTAFNDELFARLHYAKGRDDFANILRDVRVHRQYLQQHFDTLFNELYVGKSLDALFDKVDLDQWREGLGFYLKRYDAVAYAYIVVYVTNSKTVVEDLAEEMSKISGEVITLKAQAGNVKTGGSISQLFETMSNRINKAAAELLLDANPSDFNITLTQAYGTVQEAVGEDLVVKGSFVPFITHQSSYTSKEMAKLLVTGYYAGLVDGTVLAQDIDSYVPSDASVTQNGSLIFTKYDDWFDQSQALIDALVKKFVNKTSVTFGTGESIEQTLIKFFMAGDFRSFISTGVDHLRKINGTELQRLMEEFVATAPFDFINTNVVNVFDGQVAIGGLYRFNDAVVTEFAKRVGQLPADKSFSSTVVNALFGYIRYDGSSNKALGIAGYFSKRPDVFFNKFIEFPNTVVEDSIINYISVGKMDVDAYVDKVISTFKPGTSTFETFNTYILGPAFGPLLTVDQIAKLVNAGLLDNPNLRVLIQHAPNMADGYLAAGRGVVDLLNTIPGLNDHLQHRSAFLAKVYNGSSTVDKDVVKVRLEKLIGQSYHSDKIAEVLGADAVNDYAAANPDLVVGLVFDDSARFIKLLDTKTLNVVMAKVFDTYVKLPNSYGLVEGLNTNGLWGKLSTDNVKRLFIKLNAYDRNQPPSQRELDEQILATTVVELWGKDSAEGEVVFGKMPIEERRLVAKAVHSKNFMNSAKTELAGDNIPIKPLVDLTADRINQIMKYNDIKVPRVTPVRDNTTLTELMAKNVAADPLNKLAVTEDVKTDQELEEMTIEYDAFNRYKHGNIAVKILRSFNVSIPVQEKGFADWVAKMNAEGTDPQILRPMFHGTGSIAASMILRYGFKVISANDSSVVGRMLGDGIYFSNVLDKVSQYMSDGGYSRGTGVKGYIFEMEVSLGKYQRDFKAAGPGTGYDQSRVISPEWAVFNANEQTRIYKAYECQLIDKNQMSALKSKHGINENTSVVGIKHFTNFINEAGPGGKMKNAVVFIFMDGTIPVSKTKAVDFEDFDVSKFGKHVRLDWSGSGPTVQIATNGPGGVYCVRSTKSMMYDREKITQFLDYLNGKA